jgi:hypothetical protein
MKKIFLLILLSGSLLYAQQDAVISRLDGLSLPLSKELRRDEIGIVFQQDNGVARIRFVTMSEESLKSADKIDRSQDAEFWLERRTYIEYLLKKEKDVTKKGIYSKALKETENYEPLIQKHLSELAKKEAAERRKRVAKAEADLSMQEFMATPGAREYLLREAMRARYLQRAADGK